jgi:hypothetical protein
MAEIAEQRIERGRVTAVTSHESPVTQFEPEVLAFCCEH